MQTAVGAMVAKTQTQVFRRSWNSRVPLEHDPSHCEVADVC